jgi:lipopolysaccharide assembly outer membrane protein LptD (OstA)
LVIKFYTKLLTAEVAKVILLLLIIGQCFSSARAQQDVDSMPHPDSLMVSDSLTVIGDSISKVDTVSKWDLYKDAFAIDSTRFINTPDSAKVGEAFGLSPNAVNARIDYKADDSIRLDLRTQRVYMYTNSDISYQDINLKADYVEIEFVTKTVFARGTEDSLGKPVGRPIFTMADNSFESESMKYNYETKKGLVSKVITEDAEGYLHGTTVKKMPDDVTNVLDGSYTTCNLEEHPHFKFQFKKAKMIPDNKIITGPAYLVIEDVPTPLFIPFGMFPNKKGQRSGIIIPTWGESTNRGFYFENGGYYWGINEYLDFQLVGDIYTLGSWTVKPSMNYRKRYKFNGALTGEYGNNIIGEQGAQGYSQTKTFAFIWRHAQDPKARPKSKFSANVNLRSSEQNKYASSSSVYLSNTFQSSINYSTNWAGKYFLNMTLKHQQNTITHELNLSLPTVSFTVNRFYPFRARLVSGKLKWYENISVNYDMVADNRINTYDTLLFKEDIGSIMKNGIKHSVKVSSGSIKLLNYINWSSNFNYTERWYPEQQIKSWRNDTLYKPEGPEVGFVGIDTLYGFYAVRDFSVGTNLTTKLYGMYTYKNGPVKAIRHVITPTLSFSMRPDFSTQQWGYYQHYTNSNGDVEKYSMYDNSIYGTAPEGRSGALAFRLSNSLEMKVRSRKDTISGTKKVVLIEEFSLSTGYDFARDSLNLSRLVINGRTTLFKELKLNYGSTFDPYVLDSAGRRLNIFEWQVNNRLFRPENHNWSLGISYRFSSKNLQNKGDKNSKAGTEEELRDVKENIEGYVDWNVPWSLNISYDVRYTNNYTYKNGYWNYDVDKNKNIVQNLSFSGDVNITPKWKVGFSSGYDFENKDFTYTSIDVYRDLHCWEMRFNWVPLGFRQSWNFTINIKSSLLQDLKLDKKKDYRDYY